jgi:YHS domain-containing protein
VRLIMVIMVLLAVPAVASAKSVYNTNWLGVAIKGYDPVAYFTEKMPVKGSSDHELSWKGAKWHFASANNLEIFRSDPERYAPRYGGYCAYGVANNYLVKIDPDAWTVHEGKLYLNYSLKVREQWKEDIPGFIEKADRNWPGLVE